uniref:Uncharacterized protein n=1 Tax=uncultured Nocardioidaceae bacterium TaxID=253824 RepID=A0A6J4KQ21_9ACTN|nr:MAG: hypothetical protein AVDCRST_MAG46-234 [uncultured Nocardioidaceae bacterium]
MAIAEVSPRAPHESTLSAQVAGGWGGRLTCTEPSRVVLHS